MSSELQMLPLNDSRNKFLLGTSFAPIFKSVVKQKPAFKKQREEREQTQLPSIFQVLLIPPPGGAFHGSG